MARAARLTLAGVPGVNLLPRSEIERRERDALGRRWIWGVLGALVLSALLVAAAFAWNFVAQQRLVAEQARTTTLLGEIGALSSVNGALAAERELLGFRAEAMGADLAWAPVFTKVDSVLPEGATLVGFELIPGAPPATDVEPEGATGLSGKVTIDSLTPVDMAPVVRELRGVEAVVYVDGRSVDLSTTIPGHYTYVIDLRLDQTIYSGEFAQGGQ